LPAPRKRRAIFNDYRHKDSFGKQGETIRSTEIGTKPPDFSHKSRLLEDAAAETLPQWLYAAFIAGL
ncbi:MAG: hypothetical protein P8X69_05540, partial [Maritimibacter sp.]